ncbi:unnamed protein product [Ranitomeya imitator]|uniref:RRM domain-containing protein n=1 Tax=Ranitomeya imitator TaxID=111125 RepID=A0ABN9KQC1_9NEOB|nr:unnamed protein product [Ranitomeya imitator]
MFEISARDIFDLLKDYEIKYCYVDKNKRTAFITLTNGEQAQDAISRFHEYVFREKEIWLQLQPTDALLCITNLPPSLTLQEFEDLVKTYGSVERCLLVYSELSGHFKGYGFVEYMKKDSASKARLELLGKQLEEFTLFAQWVDVNQLTEDFIHSKCLCVDKLPKDYSNTELLTETFSSLWRKRKVDILEVSPWLNMKTAQQAEEVKASLNWTTVNGSRVQVSFCAPGSPGRSALAALVAAQGMLQNNRKGLLPEPNPAQIMQSLNNPAMLQMLLQPQQRGLSGKHGSSRRPPFVNPTVSQALLQLNQHQKPGLVGNLMLQNFPHLQMAQQQLLQLKSPQSNNGVSTQPVGGALRLPPRLHFCLIHVFLGDRSLASWEKPRSPSYRRRRQDRWRLCTESCQKVCYPITTVCPGYHRTSRLHRGQPRGHC